MALLAPRRLTAPAGRYRFGDLGARTLFVLAIGLAASAAQAQVTIGGNHSPDVIVDQSVLDQLGPAPTLPQLFGAHGASESRGEAPDLRPRPAAKPSHSGAKAKKAAKTHKSVHRKSHPTTSAHKARPAHKLEAKRQPTVHAAPSRQTAAKSPPAPQGSKPAAAPPGIAIDAPPPPAPLPPAPQPIAVPPPPVVPPVPPHIEAPSPGGKPQPDVRADSAPTPLVPTPAAASAAKPDTPAAKPAPHAAPVQVASVANVGRSLSVVKFAPGMTELPAGDQPVLDAMAARLLANDALRVQLVSHATGAADEAMEARRVSLARAVAVRAYLIGKGVRSLRVDVRALGNHPDEGPVADEVDLVVVTQ